MNVLAEMLKLSKRSSPSQIRWITSRARRGPMKVQLKKKRPAEPVLKRDPPDDVYFVDKWKRNMLPVSVALDELRHIGQLEEQILSDGQRNDILYATVCLDMGYTEPENNKRKYMGNIAGRLFYPVPFKGDWKVLAIVGNDEEEEMARNAGSDFVGGENLIQSIANEEIAFDFICSTPTAVNLLAPVKKMLKEKFPSKKNGSLQINIGDAVKKLKGVVLYKSHNERENFTLPCGTLDFAAEDVTVNLQHLIKEMYKHKHTKITAESYLTNLNLSTCPLSSFPLDISPFLQKTPEPRPEKQVLPQWEEDLLVIKKLEQMLN